MGSWRKKKYAPKLKAPTVRGPVEDSALMEYQPSYPPASSGSSIGKETEAQRGRGLVQGHTAD